MYHIIKNSLIFVTIDIPLPCLPFDVRESNQTYRTTQGFYSIIEANIEVCIDGAYVAVCDLGWDDNDAQLACNVLGYNEPFYRMLHHIIIVLWPNNSKFRWSCHWWAYCYCSNWY